MPRKLKIFLVDDDPQMVGLLTRAIKHAGHTIESTDNSHEAVGRMSRFRPHCAIVDLMMPGLDGLEVCKAIRASRALRNVKIVVISSKSYEFDRRRALELGADGFLVKPFKTDELLAEIDRILADKIDLTFWGVRGTLPVTGRQALKYGGNTNCVTVEFTKGPLFIFDAGTGIKPLSDHLMASAKRGVSAKIFISHPHWDHINALPFFVPLYVQGNEFEICGASHGDVTVREMISAQMDGVYFPIKLKEFGARVYFRDLREENFEVGEVAVRTKLLTHPGKCLGYRLDYKGRSICYVTDNELFPRDSGQHNERYRSRLTDFIQGTDVLITDTTYTAAEYRAKVGWGHSSVEQVVELAHKARVKKLFLFHHDPDQGDDAIDAKLKTARGLLKAMKSKTACVAPREGERFSL